MILYFTGTGNSRFVAEALADRMEEATVCLNDYIKYRREGKFESQRPFLIVAPIYAWRLPRILEDFLEEAVFTGNRMVYVIATMGSQTGNCGEYCRKLFQEKGMEYMGFRGVPMPDNYVIASKMPDQETVHRILSEALTQLDEIAETIRDTATLYKRDKTPAAGVMSGPVNRLFYRLFTSDKNYAVSDACTSCGLCAQLCPMDNIRMNSGRPEFRGDCTACYACIHHCPSQAIDIKGKTEKHGRYICPEYREFH